MNTKVLMISSAIFLGLTGLILTFLPQETIAFLGESKTEFNVVVLQILGAFYLGFAMLNWIARGNLIGGIYSRPVAIGNSVHFTISSLTLIKSLLNNNLPDLFWVISIFYLFFAVSFGYILFKHPKQ